MKQPKNEFWRQATAPVRMGWHRVRRHTNTLHALHIRNRSLEFTERFVLGWLAVFALAGGLLIAQQNQLASYYLDPGPAEGGEFREGIVGEIGALNPIYDGNQVSRSAERLIFSGLFRYDGRSQLTKDLAADYKVSEDEERYTVTIRDNATWHDGRPLTAEDVAFTFQAIQNPETGSSLQVQWEDINVEVLDEHTVEFELPNPYAPFLHQLTTGIAPEHELGDVEPERLRVAGFNENPIGSGPFRFDRIASGNEIRMTEHTGYYGQHPRVDRFTLAVFESDAAMASSYNRGELSSMVADYDFDMDLMDSDHFEVNALPVTTQVFNFYNTENLEDASLRRALTYATDTDMLVRASSNNLVRADSPLRPEHPGYQPVLDEYDPAEAEELLEGLDWSRNEDGLWERDGETLEIDMATQDRKHYVETANAIAEQWREFGVMVDVAYHTSSELHGERIVPRDFDALVFGIALEPDPDVFAYWHSSQATDEGGNVSLYNSRAADVNLEDGRTRTDPQLRAAKYETFHQVWSEDAPAQPLYRPQYTYIQRERVQGTSTKNVMSSEHRYHNVTEWSVHTEPILKRER